MITEPRLMNEPDLPGYEMWVPAVGDTVWSNHDSGPPMGVVVGYLDHPGVARHGQPVIEYRGADQTRFGRKHGDRFVCHPTFLWPFEPGSEEHKQAQREGRFR